MTTFGIDLGTTFSCIARYDAEHKTIEVINNREGKNTTPSVVYVENGESIVVGETAINQLRGPKARQVVSFTKRLIANDMLCESGEFNDYPAWKGERLTPVTTSAFILKKLSIDNPNVRNMIGDNKPKVVITFPAYFTQSARKRTQQAGEIAGLQVLGMIEEPIAAAISYGFGEKSSNETVLVYDLGGGTFDVTVVSFDGNGHGQVLAKEGDPQLGGVDWDNAFGYYIWEQYAREYPQKISLAMDDFRDSQLSDLDKLRKVNAFRLLAQNAKHNLTNSEEYDVECDAEGNTVTVSRQDFDQVTSELLQSTLSLTSEVLKGVNASISSVLLVGGSSLMPQVQEGLERRFPQFQGKIRLEDPHQAVAKGAAIYAHSLDGKELGSGLPPTPPIRNIAAMSYGIDCFINDVLRISNIVAKKDPLPVTKKDYFTTREENQRCIAFNIFEADTEKHDIGLDEGTKISDRVEVHFERPVPKGTGIEVEFSINNDGLLKMTAKSMVDSGHVELTLQLKGVLTDAEVSAAAARMSATSVAKK